jgi:hypothetical protein
MAPAEAGVGAWIKRRPTVGTDSKTHDARVALDSTDRAMLVALNSSGACLRVHRLLYIAGVCRQRFHQQQHLVASRRHIRQ